MNKHYRELMESYTIGNRKDLAAELASLNLPQIGSFIQANRENYSEVDLIEAIVTCAKIQANKL